MNEGESPLKEPRLLVQPGADSANLAFDPARGFGVYVHWPYCTRVCPYCDFNVYAAKSRDPEPVLEAILRDLEGWRARTGSRQADSLFLGGGTPSLLSGSQVAQLIEAVHRLWGFRTGAEITLEANPDDAGRFAGFAAAGVNRLSLGVQSLRDPQLAFLGRMHDAATAKQALSVAMGKFRSVSIDLIYGLPGQGGVAWREELGEALGLGADHLSLYQLTVEPETAFGRRTARGEWSPLADDASADLYEITQGLCEAAGYQGYEISNHARGKDHESVHNRIYWRGGDWAGVGPGAHGRLTANGRRLATEALARPGDYLRRVTASGVGWGEVVALSPLSEARERVAMGLRVAEGFAQADVRDLGLTLDAAHVLDLMGSGLLKITDGRVALTPQGRLTGDRIAALIAP